ncbi:MAG: hypothetical protein R6V15_06195 [Desulfotignum sp.]
MGDHALFTAVSLVELLLYPAGLLLCFRLWNRTMAEAAAAALVTTLMLLSLFQQAAMVLPLPGISFLPEAGGIGALFFAWKYRKGAVRVMGDLKNFLPRRHPVILILFAICWGYMGVRAFFFVPHPHHLKAFDTITQATGTGFFPSNAMIISGHFLRSGSTLGAGLPGFFAYTSLLFSTYALSRRYAWVPIAFTVTAVVASMPRFVFHGVTPGFEIIPAAVALFFLLLVYRLIETPGPIDFCLAVTCLGFLFSHGNGAFVFSIVLTALFCLLMVRRHGFSPIKTARHHWKTLAVSLLPALLFSRLWTGIPAVFDGVEKNREVLAGAAASFLGYVISSLDASFFLDLAGADKAVSAGLLDFLEKIYYSTAALLFTPDSSVPAFGLSLYRGEGPAWFGPLAFFLVQPAVAVAMFRGPRRLKAVVLALAVYVYLVCLIPGWHPGNVSFFSFFYALAGFSTAFLLPPWRLGRRAKRGLQIICLLVFVHSCLAL